MIHCDYEQLGQNKGLVPRVWIVRRPQVLARVHARRHRPSQYHGLHPATLGDRSAAFSQLERGHGGERCQAIDGGRHLVAWWLLAHGHLLLRHQPTGVEGRVGRAGGEGAERASSHTGAEGGRRRKGESRGGKGCEAEWGRYSTLLTGC